MFHRGGYCWARRGGSGLRDGRAGRMGHAGNMRESSGEHQPGARAWSGWKGVVARDQLRDSL
jgi:hypothetical protein